MMYPSMTFDDGTQVTHSQIVHENGLDKVFVHFERPCSSGFDSARCELPGYVWTDWEGNFTAEERAIFEEFLRNHAFGYYCRGAFVDLQKVEQVLHDR